jgi:hypothetical protein
MNPLKCIIQWNSRSFFDKKEEFLHLLRSNNVTVAGVSETWLSPYIQIRIPGYHVLRDDRADGKGGAALLIHHKVPFQTLNIKPQNCPFDVVAAKIYDTVIVSLYISPSNLPSRQQLEDFFSGISQRFIVLGDFNSHHPLWGSGKCDRMGRCIVDLVNDLNICILNDGSPTRLGSYGQKPSAVDLSMADPQIAPQLSWKVLDTDTLGSDHFPILITNLCYAGYSFTHKPRKRAPRLCTHKANWTRFSERIDARIESLPDVVGESVHACFETFAGLVQEEALASIPERATKKGKRAPPPPWWDKDCEEAVSVRKESIKKLKQHMSLENYLEVKNAQANAKRLLKNRKRRGWRRFCESLSPDTPLTLVWKTINSFRHSTSQNLPLTTDSSWLEGFSHKLSPPSVPNLNEISLPYNFQTRNWMDAPFCLEELQAILPSLRDSSPGLDNILYSYITHLGEESLSYFLKIVNASFETGLIPPSWKLQRIVPILKRGKDPNSHSSYRPIALSSVFAKITEHLLKRRLEWYIESNGIMPSTQFGFRRARGTADSISLLITEVRLALSRNEHTLGACLDVSGAFDNVLLGILGQKLLSLGVPLRFTYFILNLLTERSIQIEHIFSDNPIFRMVFKGLPQGSVLSPLLFNIYTHDINKCIPYYSKILQYADDFFIFTSGQHIPSLQNILNKSLNALNTWLEKHGMQLCPSKCKLILFTRRRKIPNVVVRCQNEAIPVVGEVRFLGITLDCHLSWNAFISEVTNRCQGGLNMLRAVSRVWWGSHPITQKLFYNAYVRSQMDYATFLIEPTTKKNLGRLDKIQYQGLRLVLGAMRSSPVNALQVEALDPPLLSQTTTSLR